MRVKVAILDDYQTCALQLADWDRLADRAEITVFDRPIGSPDALARTLAPFEVLCLMRERTAFPASLLARLPRLRLIVLTGTHTTTLDVAAARAAGVTVCTTESRSGAATIELAWALILATARHLPFEDAAMRAGRWQTTLGRTLHGRRLGLVGLGRLGRMMVPVARAFGMQVAAWSTNLTPSAAAAEGAEYLDKPALFARSDVVSIHLLLSERSRHTVGAAEIALMRRDAVLVNTSRGPIVDEAALVAALRAGTLGGAGLDVYDVEPLPPDHPLRRLPNTVLSPHLGYATRDVIAGMYGQAVENILAFLDGAPIRTGMGAA